MMHWKSIQRYTINCEVWLSHTCVKLKKPVSNIKISNQRSFTIVRSDKCTVSALNSYTFFSSVGAPSCIISCDEKMKHICSTLNKICICTFFLCMKRILDVKGIDVVINFAHIFFYINFKIWSTYSILLIDHVNK